jgi:hypothetical protein
MEPDIAAVVSFRAKPSVVLAPNLHMSCRLVISAPFLLQSLGALFSQIHPQPIMEPECLFCVHKSHTQFPVSSQINATHTTQSLLSKISYPPTCVSVFFLQASLRLSSHQNLTCVARALHRSVPNVGFIIMPPLDAVNPYVDIAFLNIIKC